MNRFDEERAYRIYVTDMLFYQCKGEMLAYRYADLLNGKTFENDQRTGDEIAKDVIERCGLKHECV